MNYTTNYHLPQWVETDRIMMEDFNQAMAGIDQALGAGLTPEGTTCQYGTFSFTGSTAAGTALATFSFSPRFLILEFYERVYIIPQGSSVSLDFGMSHYTVYLQLSGNVLRISQNDEDITVNYSGRFVAWP